MGIIKNPFKLPCKGIFILKLFVLILFFLTACTSEKDRKISELTKKLEKQESVISTLKNNKLREAEIQCGKDAENYFIKNCGYGSKQIEGNLTERCSFSNHYNIKMNKCFAHIVALDTSNETGSTLITTIALDEVNEHKEYGIFADNNGRVNWCNVAGKHCRSYEEFMALIKPYMEE